MANRLAAPTLFAGLAPNWNLSSLDTNSSNVQAFANDSSLGYVNGIPVDTGVANAYAVTLPFGVPSGYQDGMCVPFIPANTNTGNSTLTVSPLGAATILNPAGLALNGGEISKNVPLLTIYKSASPTGFRIVGPCPFSIVGTLISGTTTLNCSGYTSVSFYGTWTAGTTMTVVLNGLAAGVPISVTVNNTIGSTQNFLMSATNPAGTAYTLIGVVQSGVSGGAAITNITSVGIPINNNSVMVFNGASNVGLNILLGR